MNAFALLNLKETDIVQFRSRQAFIEKLCGLNFERLLERLRNLILERQSKLPVAELRDKGSERHILIAERLLERQRDVDLDPMPYETDVGNLDVIVLKELLQTIFEPLGNRNPFKTETRLYDFAPERSRGQIEVGVKSNRLLFAADTEGLDLVFEPKFKERSLVDSSINLLVDEFDRVSERFEEPVLVRLVVRLAKEFFDLLFEFLLLFIYYLVACFDAELFRFVFDELESALPVGINLEVVDVNPSALLLLVLLQRVPELPRKVNAPVPLQVELDPNRIFAFDRSKHAIV